MRREKRNEEREERKCEEEEKEADDLLGARGVEIAFGGRRSRGEKENNTIQLGEMSRLRRRRGMSKGYRRM